MVGPGDVDEQLDAEVTEECTKYGKVVRCLIFEVRVRETLQHYEAECTNISSLNFTFRCRT